MRALVRMDEEDRARTLGDVLYAKGIQSRVDESREGGYLVWVHDEAHLEEAKEILEQFRERPEDPEFQRARREADALRKSEEKERKKTRHRTVDMRKRWQSQSGIGRLTLGLIIVSVGVTLIAGFGDNQNITQRLYFSIPHILQRFELWRIVTPIFLHLGFLHLLFNMWWLKDFGSIIEHRHSTLILAAMVLTTGILSNAGQALMVGPNFGGMSGVVYGLFGYIWIRGKLDPGSGLAVRRSTVIILVGWMLLGFSGFMRMANIAHLGGLLVGMAWGVVSAMIARRR